MLNNSIITVSSPFRFKTLFTKPLKYVIQLFTADATEHVASYCDDLVMNISGKGFEKVPFDLWMKKYAVNGAKIHEYSPSIPFTSAEDIAMRKFNDQCSGSKYNPVYATYSFLDDIKQIRNNWYRPKGAICSQQRFDCLVAAGIFPPQEDKLTPAELKKKLLKSGWKKRRVN